MARSYNDQCARRLKSARNFDEISPKLLVVGWLEFGSDGSEGRHKRNAMETVPAVTAYRFAGFVLDISRGTLVNAAGMEVPLRRQSFELLRILVENAGRLLNRDSINQGIWGEIVVSDDSITQCIGDIRRALGGEAQRILKTVPRRGYMMTAEVAVARDAPLGDVVVDSHRPSIAVLPFANLSDDPEQEYFADGMVEEIITALSRIRWLFVVARNSSFTYKGQAIDVTRVGRELDVRYLLEGSVRKAGRRVRINAQLIATKSGTHLWADRFDGSLDEVFELQDQVAIAVAGVIEPTLQAAETARLPRRPTGDPTAYDDYLRAHAMLFASGLQIPQALAVLEQAIARDPDFGPAFALAAICCFRLCADGTSDDLDTDRRKGMDFGHRALQTARDDPEALANAAFALGWFGEDIGAMIAVIDRALRLNPSHARGWYISGTLRLFAGEPDVAIQHLETALLLSPRARFGTVNLHIGMAHLVSRRFDQALPMLLLDIQDVEPNNPGPYRYLAACYAHMGRLDEARRMVERVRAITPLVIESLEYLRDPGQRAIVLSGLRLAMGMV